MLCVVSFRMSVWMFIVSKALVMSSEVMIVRCGGFFLLKPVMMVLLIWCRAVVVEWCFLNPCCVVLFEAFVVI